MQRRSSEADLENELSIVRKDLPFQTLRILSVYLLALRRWLLQSQYLTEVVNVGQACPCKGEEGMCTPLADRVHGKAHLA